MTRSGQAGEELAARFLAERGYQVVARNWRAGRTGELDIVARTGRTLVVVEVKTARRCGFGDPLEWVTPRKVKRIAALAEAFLAEHTEPIDGVRFDVMTVDARRTPPSVTHLVDAFRPNAA